MDWSGEELQEEDDVDMHAVETTNNDDRPSKPNGPDPTALDRRNTAVGGSNSHHGSCRSCRSSEEELPDSGQLSPPLFSSPSVASSAAFSRSGGFTPLRQHLSRDNHDVSSRTARQDLAKRLTLLAQRLTCGDELDESSLTRQVEQMEKAVSPPSSPRSPPRRQQSIDSPRRSETGSSLGSPLSLIRSQFSDLSVESYRDRERQREREIREEEDRQTRARLGMSVAQAKKIIAESAKLNDELSTIVRNLKARQEETEHINTLLIERTQRAAQRIVFLQSRIAYMEQELDENDDELQHLRICLKAVEVQMPPNPDQELQRCINVFKDDYHALKRKRASRSSMTSVESSQTLASPTRTTNVSYAMYK